MGQQASSTGETLSTTLLTKAGRIAVKYETKSKTAEANIPHNVLIHSRRVSRDEIKAVERDGIPPAVERTMESTFPVVSIVKGMTFALIKLPDLDALRSLRPGGEALLRHLDEGWESGFLAPYFYVIVGNDTDGTVRLRTRMIEPGCGEDPATGSAACTLASYLALQEGGRDVKFSYSVEQGVEMGRRSLIGVKVALNATGKGIGEVILSGSAVPVMEGTLSA